MDTDKLKDTLTPAFVSLTAEEVAERLLDPYRGLGGWLNFERGSLLAAYIGGTIIDLANGELTRADALDLVEFLREGGTVEFRGQKVVFEGFCPSGDTGGYEEGEEGRYSTWQEISADLRWLEENA